MGRVSTNNYKESLETGKEYLGKEFYRNVGKLKIYKPKRCKECKTVLPIGFVGTYCSEWCKEVGVKNSNILNKCKNYATCGNFTDVMYNKKNGYIANKRILCDECFKSGKYRKGYEKKTQNK